MKAIAMGILGLAFAAAAHEDGRHEEAGFPQFAVGEKRREILSQVRNGLVAAVKENRLDAMDSVLREGDREFGRRIWLSNEERLYLYLLLGHGKRVVEEDGIRIIFWGGLGLYADYRNPFPQLCTREGRANLPGATQLGYAPDLIDHLKDRFDRDRVAVMERLRTQGDLFDLLSIVRCPDEGPKGRPAARRQDFRVLEGFVRKHPDSWLTAEILRRSGIDKSWTGNGWLIGGGPAFSWQDGKTASLVDDGFQGTFFSDVNAPKLKLGVEIQIRSFTPRRPFAFDDTVVGAGRAGFRRVVVHAGESFRLGRNLFLTPFTGVIFSELNLSQADEERLGKKDKSESSVGFPVGANLDWLFPLPRQDGEEFIAAFGLRLTCAWHRGNWAEMESGLGDQGAVLGIKLFYALVGVERD